MEKTTVTVTIDASLQSDWEAVYEDDGNAAENATESADEADKNKSTEEAEPTSFERVLSLASPRFRYSFMQDKRRVKEKTGVLGVEAGDGWLEVPQETVSEGGAKVDDDVTAAPSDVAAGNDDDENSNNKKKPEEGEGDEIGEGAEADDPPPDPKPEALNVRFSKSHTVTMDEAALLQFNDFPFLTLSLQDDAAEGATATLPGQSTYNVADPATTYDEEGNEIPPAEPPAPAIGRNFLFNDVFDLSAFFSSSDAITHEYGNLTFLPNTSESGYYPRNPPPPAGLRYLKVTISVDKPLLTGPLLVKLNPLQIELRNVKDLPGVRITYVNHKHYVEPTPFKLLEKYAHPPYCIVRAFVGDEAIFPRVTRTQPAAHRPNIDFKFVTSYLTGHLDRQLLHECVESKPLSVELQDRQPMPTEEEKLAETLKWEMLLAGGHPPEPGKDSNGGGGQELSSAMDIYDVDELRLKDLHNSWATAGDHCSHGISRCYLTSLLDQSTQLAAAYNMNNLKVEKKKSKGKGKDELHRAPPPFVKERLDVQQEKRRRIPKGGLDEWQLNEGEVLIRKTGNYLSDSEVPLQHADMHLNYRSSTTSVGIKVALAEPLLSLEEGNAERTGPPSDVIFRPFTRAVYTFEYGNVKLLQALNKAFERVNETALKESMIGSLMSYQLTSEQVQMTNDATLNIICGFTVLDDDCRMVFLEGTVEGIESILEEVPRSQANDWSFRVLSNPEVRFKNRLYTDFNVDLKKVRLREPLPMLTSMPEIYNRAKVSEECFEALHRIGEIRRGDRLKTASLLQMFPTVGMVISMESKYGESISMEDILGVKPKKKIRSWMRKEEVAVVEEEVVKEVKKEVVRLKGPTDHHNAEFEEYLRSRKAPDFLALQKEQLEAAMKEAEAARERRRESDLDDSNSLRFMYSSQKLAFTEIQKERMRDRLSKEKNCTFTYSKDFTSQTVSMVDAERLKQVQEEENRCKWKTKRGFVYPAPRKKEDYAVHPSKPSQSRIDILGEEWVENELHPENVKREVKLKPGQPDFDTVPSNGKMIFGGFEAPKYSREYNSSMIGSSKTLPRGSLTLTKDPTFFHSVHLNGEEQAEEERRIKEKAKEEWRDKVVVDSLDFLVGGFVRKDRPDQLDRVRDVLDGKAIKTSLKMVRNARLPSGKKVPLRPPPFSIFNREAYKDPKDFTEDLRPNDATTYLTKDKDGKGVDFVRFNYRQGA